MGDDDGDVAFYSILANIDGMDLYRERGCGHAIKCRVALMRIDPPCLFVECKKCGAVWTLAEYAR